MAQRPVQPLQDPLAQRLRWGIVASVLVNILMWRAAAAVAKHPPTWDLRPVEITRVVIDNKGRRVEKRITKKQILKKIAQVRKEPPKPKAFVRMRQAPKPIRIASKPPPPQGMHSHVITARPGPNAPPEQDDHTALAGGNAPVGKPIETQAPGNAATPPPVAPKVVEALKPAPAVKPAPTPAPPPPPPPPPAVKEAPKPEPPPPPKKTGPSRDAEPDDEVKPEIPDDLKKGDYRSFVRVKVLVHPDGSFEPILRTSSGNPEIDRRVMDALKKWKWKPALKDGEAIESTQLFKFEFLVE
jgi:TonB family protein